MFSAVKRLRSGLLDSFVFLCLILGLLPASAEELGVLAQHIFPTKKSDPCSVVKIHSLAKAADESILHQQGQGWVTMLRREGQASEFGVVTPYHVVVNSQSVYAECRGKFIPLVDPVVDAEKDITYFGITDWDGSRTVISPLLIELGNAQIRQVVYPTDSARKIFGQFFTPKELEKNLTAVMYSMINFGVAMSPEKDMASALMLSPQGNSIVQGVVDESQKGIKQLIRVENFGIRPGISGGVLFGVPESMLSTSYDVSIGKRTYLVPIEVMPKTVLGMITKTKLNGAETVALSLPDIVSFLEKNVMSQPQALPSVPVEVHYRSAPTSDGGAQLQSYLSVPMKDSALVIQEVCSSEFKNSADLKLLENKELQKYRGENRLGPEMQRPFNPLEIQLNDLQHRKKSEPEMKQDMKNLEDLRRRLQQRSGGGEYGEGGDGFTSKQAQFLTSKSTIGVFKKESQDLGFDVLSQATSFGLYLKNQSCTQQGLWIGDRVINAVAMPEMDLMRMVTYEDVRQFAKKFPEMTGELIAQFGVNEKLPFFTFQKSWKESLKIPIAERQTVSSTDTDWQPGGKIYFKEKFSSVLEGESFLEVSSERVFLNTRITGVSSSAEKMGWLQFRYENSAWQGRFALNAQCQVSLKPESFKNIHPWLVEYDDGKNQIKIEMGTQHRFLAISFQKIDCPSMKDLALGEIEIFTNAASAPVIGTRRTAFIPQTINLEFLRKALESKTPYRMEQKSEK